MKITLKRFMLSVGAVSALFLTSCSTVYPGSGAGLIYTNVTEGQTATSNSLGSKRGEATATGILGLVSTGDASIQTAAKTAGITKISHVDTKKKSILGIVSKYTTVVYGE